MEYLEFDSKYYVNLLHGNWEGSPPGACRVLGQLGDKRSVAECEAMIHAYDLDGDGGLDFHDFQRMMS